MNYTPFALLVAAVVMIAGGVAVLLLSLRLLTGGFG